MKKKVLILMGSESDRDKMEKAIPILRDAGVEVSVAVSSAHRQPDRTAELARTARAEGFSVVICGAGLSAALPGVVAAHTELPVIGVPLNAALGGLDALLSVAQMPPGVPVACVGIDNARNAAHLALRILQLS
ncbi:MAG TPA: 5-(carboxyamino)imidazole ribonucleotide mutase [Longimicrobiales bacterium]|nr:5-(carboxyamino)imidazole ribonucleotide mutase [Longimicrobiales bacterium]